MLQADFIQRVRTCERRLYRVARTMLPQESDCEDAVQEALLRARDRRETLRQEAYSEMWMIRILINQCKTFYRRRPPEPAELTEDIPQASPEETPLLEALMSLPRKQRVTLNVDGECGPATLSALQKAITALEDAKPAGQTVTIVGGNCYVRTSPSTAGTILDVVRKGDTLPYEGQTVDNGWHAVTYNGVHGWVSGKYGKLK